MRSAVSFANERRRIANMHNASSAKPIQTAVACEGVTLQQRLLRGIDALASRLGRAPRIPPHLAAGLRGEEEAFFYLRQHGYVVVARRWRTPKLPGDVDLIAWHGDTLCFIEVKTRGRRDIVPAEFAVDARKQRVLRSLASVFRKRLPEETRRQTLVRFDVVSVYLPGDAGSPAEIELFPAAFAHLPS
jgi:putative endonuclease